MPIGGGLGGEGAAFLSYHAPMSGTRKHETFWLVVQRLCYVAGLFFLIQLVSPKCGGIITKGASDTVSIMAARPILILAAILGIVIAVFANFRRGS